MNSLSQFDIQPNAFDDTRVVLQGVTMTGDLRGTIFEAHVQQHYLNTSDNHVEAVYTFPLPWGAVLLGIEIQLGDQKLTGSVIGKAQAEDQYEEAISNGDAAIMVDTNGNGHYVVQIGNLAPGEKCVIDMRYGQSLPLEQGSLRLAIPTVIAPAYGDPIKDGGLAPHQVPETDILAEHGFKLTLNLHGDLAKGRIKSPSHSISLGRDNGNQILSITLSDKSYLDRDFVLIVDQLEQNSVVAIGQDYADDKQYVVTASFNPTITEPQVQKTVLKILVDCSGSMNGASMTAARRALIEIIKSLKDGDQFSLSKFGSTVEHRSRSLWKVTDKSRLSAEQWITALQADMGGTEMLEAIESTAALPHSERCDMLLITDGQIYAIEQATKLARESGHRIFVVGIGSSPNNVLLHKIAKESKGASEFVAPNETVTLAIMKMFNRLRLPVISHVSVAWDTDCTPSIVTTLDATAFDGDTLEVSAWFSSVPKGRVSLYGQLEGKEVSEELGSVVIDCAPSSSSGLSRIAAAKREAKTTDPKEAAKIALDYQLVTKQTNFLMVHERSAEEKATGMPALHKVKQMVPAGLLVDTLLNQSNDIMYSRMPRAGQFDIANYSAPTLMRNPKGFYKKQLDTSFKELCENYQEIPAFLRRQKDPLTDTYLDGQRISIKALFIWKQVNDAQETILAILSENPDGNGVRIWFVNEKNEIFDYMDFDHPAKAESALVVNGFSDFVKKRFSILSRFRTKYVWRCGDGTRVYTDSNNWMC